MKVFKTIVLLLAILFPFIPQQKTTNSSNIPEVKSVSIHQVKVPQAINTENPLFQAQAIYVLDLNSNTALYQKNSQESLYPASLTKIMTAVVALEHFSIDQVLSVKSADLSIGNTMNLRPGDKLTTQDLIYGLLVSSGNDAALALAENFPGGYSKFVQAMNKKSKNLGLKQTNYNNTSGVEDPNHITTALDLTLLTQHALKNPIFRQAVSTKYKEIKSLDNNQYHLYSTNELLDEVEGIQGVKTGWTPEAGECLITLVNQNNHPILITILGSEDRFEETKLIINWVYENFSWD